MQPFGARAQVRRKGESPRTAATREVAEELGINVQVVDPLVLDWAPHPAEGDKLLLIFRGGILDREQLASLKLDNSEIAEAAFFSVEQLPSLMPDRLARRVIEAASQSPQSAVEVDRVVSRAGTVSLADRVVLAAEILAGRQVGVRIEPEVLMFFGLTTRELLRTRPNPLAPRSCAGSAAPAGPGRRHGPRPSRSGSSAAPRTPG